MAARKITLHCDIPVRDILCSAIRDYAHAAYPEGGSECAQVARYTLLELAAAIEAGIDADNPSVEISKRPRAMVRAAIEYYFDRLDAGRGGSSASQRELLAGLLDEKAVTAADLQVAAAADQSA